MKNIEIDVYKELDDLANYDIKLSKEDLYAKISLVLYKVLEDKSYEGERITPKGSKSSISINDSYLSIEYETTITNELYIYYDVYLGIVSNKGKLERNGKSLFK